MPSATASGADTGGSARARGDHDHKQGNQGRTYTAEQEKAVIRIRRCAPTAFYDILALESVKTTCTESDIKKAYRKQSLLTHPDKNGHDKADEAFKMVSRAFGVLGDKEKREQFDRTGGDPDSRFGQAQAQNPFSGFASRAGGGGGGRPPGFGGRGGGMFDEDISPEEMFARFFGGGGGFGGGGFGGPEFVFNFGGGPGVRVHQFGGGRPRGRPRTGQPQGQQQEQNPLSNLISLLPILLFFVLPMITSLFNFGDSTPATPRMVFDNPIHPFTHARATPNYKVPYFVNPADISKHTDAQLDRLDQTAEVSLVRQLRSQCENEIAYKRRLRENAMGFFFQDDEKMAHANAVKTPSCDRLGTMGIRR